MADVTATQLLTELQQRMMLPDEFVPKASERLAAMNISNAKQIAELSEEQWMELNGVIAVGVRNRLQVAASKAVRVRPLFILLTVPHC